MRGIVLDNSGIILESAYQILNMGPSEYCHNVWCGVEGLRI